MAYISGTYGSSSTYVKHRVVATLLSTNIIDNTDEVNFQIQAWRTNSGYTTKGSGTSYLTISGVGSYSQSISNTQEITQNSYTVLYNANHTIPHNADGTRSVTVNSNYNLPSVNTGTEGTFTFTLPTIPRASTITATTANIGEVSSININRAVSSFTHTLNYAFGGLSLDFATGVETSYGWTIPTSFYAQIPNAVSGTGTLTCHTYSGATYIGTSTFTFTVNVSNINKPDVSAVIKDTNTITKLLTGNENIMVKYFSNANFDITATPKNSATISSRSIVAGAKSSALGTGTLNNIETGIFNISAVDSRGLSNSLVVTKTIIDYIPLTLNPILKRVTPTNGLISLNITGNYFNSTFGAVSNTLEVKYRYREVGGTWSSYTTITMVKTGNTYSYSATLAGTFDYTKAFDFELVATDKLISLINNSNVDRGIPVFNWNKTKFTHNTPVYMKDTSGVYKNIIDLFMPVGKVEMTVNNVNPSTRFPGTTWIAWGTGRVPVGVDAGQTEFNTVEKTGGAKTHVLTINELPNAVWHTLSSLTGGLKLLFNSGSNYGINSSSTDANQPHNNLPPYITCYYWKRTA